VSGVPISNYLGWFAFAVLLMAALSLAAGPAARARGEGDAPILALWIWTYASSVLAHAVFLGLPASAAWGGVIMGAAVVPAMLRRPA
jgi:putative membrane protein